MTADGKYSFLNRDNLKQPVHMKLSQKWKTFSRIFFAVLKSALNFENFQKKYDCDSWRIFEIVDSEKRG